MNISLDVVEDWMTYLRQHPENRDRFLECFWPSQLKSKVWLIQKLHHLFPAPRVMYVFGGWYGVFAQLLAEEFPSAHIVSVDIDPTCAEVGEYLCRHRPNIVFETQDMGKYGQPLPGGVVINTSTEHVSQETYNSWWNKILPGTPFYLQGNNLDIPEHIRYAASLDHFRIQNLVDYPHIATDALYIDGGMTRYMAWGKK